MRTQNLTRDEAAERSANLYIHSYQVELDLSDAKDLTKKTFGVHAEVEFDSKSSETFIDFTGDQVSEVVVNGSPQEVDYNGAVVVLKNLKNGLNNVQITAQAYYSSSGEGLHRFRDLADGQVFLYTQYEPADSRRVFPNFDQPDLKAEFSFIITAPSDWTVLSNQKSISAAQLAQVTKYEFAPTKRQSSYLTAIIAGPYVQFEDSWTSPSGDLEIPLRIFCRASLGDYADPENIFKITKQGLDFYHRVFDYPYPWGKYDQIFVPEYNLGAMENPGCVTFTDNYIFRSTATYTQYEKRANTILHEMCHMWFGDLVTPKWWDELWLKESFAEFMGAYVSALATEFTDAWVAFAGIRKSWALKADQFPTTHPISADVANLEAAKQNFDGITYAKGAAALKQLVAFVGEDEFFAGCRSYFKKYAFSSTTLEDLLVELNLVSGRDVNSWAKAWVKTSGIDLITPQASYQGRSLTSLELIYESVDSQTGKSANRPHRLNVAAYTNENNKLKLAKRWELYLDSSQVLKDAAGVNADVILVNESDLSYLKTRFDHHSYMGLKGGLSTLEDSLSRALVWSIIFDEVRDGIRSLNEALELVRIHADLESQVPILENTCEMLKQAIVLNLNLKPRLAVAKDLSQICKKALAKAKPGSGLQLVWMRTLIWAARLGHIDLREMLDNPPVGLDLSPEIRWGIWHSASANGLASEADLKAELVKDNTSQGANYYLTCKYAQPDIALKNEAWQRMLTPNDLSNEQLDAVIEGFNQLNQDELLANYQEPFFTELENIWQNPPAMALRLVKGLYPVGAKAIELGEKWMAAHSDIAFGLKRVVLEGHDTAKRAQRNRLFNGG